MKIAIDIGFGYVKASNDKGQDVIFPSMYKKVVGTEAQVVAFGGYDSDYRVDINGKPYYVGDLAKQQRATRTFRNQTEFDREMIEVFVGTVLNELTTDEKSVEVRLGLPLWIYKENGRNIGTLIKNKEFEIKKNGLAKTMKVSTVKVLAQGIGAYAKASSSDEIDPLDTIGLVDVGFRTVDFLVLDEKMLVNELTDSLEEQGMNYLLDDIVNALNGVGIRKKPDRIEKLLIENEKIKINGVEKSLRDFSEEYYRKHAENIISEIKRRWGDSVNDMSKIILTGGGGLPLLQYFEKAFGDIVVLQKDNQLANVKGYLVM